MSEWKSEQLAIYVLPALPLTGCEIKDRLFSLWNELFYSLDASLVSPVFPPFFFEFLSDAFGTLSFWPPSLSFISHVCLLSVPQLRFDLISLVTFGSSALPL